MKHIKTFELVNKDTPKKGDYAVVKMSGDSNKGKQFIDNNIGKIIKTNGYNDNFLIQYDVDFNTCGFTKGHFQFLEDPNGQRNINKNNIIYWSDNKEELEQYIINIKYNL